MASRERVGLLAIGCTALTSLSSRSSDEGLWIHAGAAGELSGLTGTGGRSPVTSPVTEGPLASTPTGSLEPDWNPVLTGRSPLHL